MATREMSYARILNPGTTLNVRSWNASIEKMQNTVAQNRLSLEGKTVLESQYALHQTSTRANDEVMQINKMFIQLKGWSDDGMLAGTYQIEAVILKSFNKLKLQFTPRPELEELGYHLRRLPRDALLFFHFGLASPEVKFNQIFPRGVIGKHAGAELVDVTSPRPHTRGEKRKFQDELSASWQRLQRLKASGDASCSGASGDASCSGASGDASGSGASGGGSSSAASRVTEVQLRSWSGLYEDDAMMLAISKSVNANADAEDMDAEWLQNVLSAIDTQKEKEKEFKEADAIVDEEERAQIEADEAAARAMAIEWDGAEDDEAGDDDMSQYSSQYSSQHSDAPDDDDGHGDDHRVPRLADPLAGPPAASADDQTQPIAPSGAAAGPKQRMERRLRIIRSVTEAMAASVEPPAPSAPASVEPPVGAPEDDGHDEVAPLAEATPAVQGDASPAADGSPADDGRDEVDPAGAITVSEESDYDYFSALSESTSPASASPAPPTPAGAPAPPTPAGAPAPSTPAFANGECVVCFEEFDGGAHKRCVRHCGHSLCRQCAVELEHSECPQCRRYGGYTIDYDAMMK